jgi:hypothetical protein
MAPEITSRWQRTAKYDPKLGPYNGYTVVAITNTGHAHENHEPQVIYRGDNGLLWSRPLVLWPGSLKPEDES